MKPAALVVDSVQTMYSTKFQSAPGSISQVREVATQLLFLAKGRGITTFLIGHVTKDGNLAGPKSLEHIVDTVLYFEGEKQQHHRIVRAVKNRFGAVSELGVFEMTEHGPQPVANPSALFLAERHGRIAGLRRWSRPWRARARCWSRCRRWSRRPRSARRGGWRSASTRTARTCCWRCWRSASASQLMSDDVFVSVAGGLEVNEPAADLGVAAAIASSFRNRPVPANTVVFGEVGLAGEVRAIGQAGPARARGGADGVLALHPARRGTCRSTCPASSSSGVASLEGALERLFDEP